jgi:CDP-paratose 2-epimerase
MGGGRANSVSILECIDTVERMTGRPFEYDYVDAPRKGDHICYITDLRKFQSHYPEWSVTKDLPAIWEDMMQGEARRYVST